MTSTQPNAHYLIPDWPAPANVKAFCSLRFDGHSQGAYASFNLGKCEQNLQAVLTNRQQLHQELALPQEPVWLSQVHGTRVIQADSVIEPNPEADAAFTQTPHVVCTVLTADCLPILFCDTQGQRVAAAHAGWRGLAAGVIEATLQHLATPPEQLLVWLGPAIGPTAFEVSDEVRDQFISGDIHAAAAFQAKNPGKWLADIFQLAKLRLINCGINRIYGGQFCTYSDAARFYSYRRDQGKTGRMASLIWLDH